MSDTTKEATREAGAVVDVAPETARQWLERGDTVLVDVREDFEYAAERIEGAEHAPLSTFDPSAVRRLVGGRRVVFQCRTGNRSKDAALRFRDGDEGVFHLAGGIEGWKSSRLPTRRSESAPRIDVMRQVQMTAGSLVLLGVVLGVTVSEWFLLVSGFVGAGLLFAGASGWCGMAMLLGKMPWNRRGVGA